MRTVAYVDYDQVMRVAYVVQRLDIKPDPFVDPRYYPPPDTEPELAVAYFTAMVAIDHRTHLKRPYILKIGDEEYRGADLLWRLGKEMFDQDPEFFTADRLANLDENTVRRWLEPQGLELWDVNIRTLLLRDLGRKTKVLFSGSFAEIVRRSGGWLYREGQGFVELLKVFRAYEDPVEKKAFLLVKFLYRRGYLKVVDPENLQIPVDNHVTRLAFRTGIIKLREDILELVRNQIEVPQHIDIEIRLAVRKAWRLVADRAGIDPTVLDDFLWSHGRSICRPEEARCSACPLRQVCMAYEKGEFLPEHKFELTWYY